MTSVEIFRLGPHLGKHPLFFAIFKFPGITNWMLMGLYSLCYFIIAFYLLFVKYALFDLQILHVFDIEFHNTLVKLVP